MHTRRPAIKSVVMMLTLMAIGCREDENARLAEMAERNLERQAAQNQQFSELQREVAEGARQLVDADAKARQDIVTLQREVQAERAEVGRQRDVLETERRQLAVERRVAPIVASSISSAGLLLACLLPIVLCWLLLRQQGEITNDQLVAEVLLEDSVADHPLLLPPQPSPGRALGLPVSSDDCSPRNPGSSQDATM